MIVNAVIIPSDPAEPAVLAPLEPSLARAQRVVGGYLEGLPSDVEAGWVAYGNEEAKIINLPRNIRAHDILVELGGHNPSDVLRGPVVFFGFGDDGEWQSVPGSLVEQLRERLALVEGLAPQ